MGQQWLAGLLAHAPGAAVFGTSTANGFGRFKPNALAPLHALWGRDNRGAMLRLIGTPGDPATRLENRIGEPAANPYAYIAAQIHAGLGGVQRGLTPPPPTDSPYAPEVTSAAASAVRSAVASSSAPTRTPPPTALPASLGAALDALQADATLCADMGAEFVEAFVRIKRQEAARRDAADDADTFDRREYFGRL
jgi:glutamine synthetase